MTPSRGYWRLLIPLVSGALMVVAATHFGGLLAGAACAMAGGLLLTLVLTHRQFQAIQDITEATRTRAGNRATNREHS